MFHSALLGLHIASASSALLLGPLAMRAAKRPGIHTTAGEAYHWVYLMACAAAGTLAIVDWSQFRWFLPIAIGSYAFAFVGYLAAKLRWRNWLTAHISGQGGSYIALVTALLVVNFGDVIPIVWLLPTIVGSPLIVWTANRVKSGPLVAPAAIQHHVPGKPSTTFEVR